MTAKHILLLDDDPAITQLLSAKLRAARPGLRTTVAHDGSSGLQLARSTLPDLIVCDIDLGPGRKDGGDIAFELRNHPSTAAIPLVFLSSMILPGDMGERSGGAVMVSKLAGTEKIVRAILAALP
jgi:CheY-like chemotaxis protein